jgi:leader peptidase (prepilin peptidase)/N-methyltransferase
MALPFAPDSIPAQALAFWLGACLGSFANVLVFRLPKEISIVWPPSACPSCKARIAWYDNIPVLGWVWLRGKCRRCRRPISPRYPAVELFMGAAAVALWQRWSDASPAWAALSALAACVLVAVTLIDWDTFLIPDELSLGLLAVGLAVAPLNPLYWGFPAWQGWLLALRGAAAGFAMCYAVAWAGELIFGQEAMGGGDIKLLAAVGAWSGGVGAFDCLMLGSVIGSVYGLGLMLRGRAKRSDPIPFGPFLSAGAVFNLFIVLPLGFPFLPATW